MPDIYNGAPNKFYVAPGEHQDVTFTFEPGIYTQHCGISAEAFLGIKGGGLYNYRFLSLSFNKDLERKNPDVVLPYETYPLLEGFKILDAESSYTNGVFGTRYEISVEKQDDLLTLFNPDKDPKGVVIPQDENSPYNDQGQITLQYYGEKAVAVTQQIVITVRVSVLASFADVLVSNNGGPVNHIFFEHVSLGSRLGPLELRHPPKLFPHFGSMSIGLDLHERLCAAFVGEVNVQYEGSFGGVLSKDAGHTFVGGYVQKPTGGPIPDSTGENVSLLVDRPRNRYRIIYEIFYRTTTDFMILSGTLTDQFVADAGSPVKIKTVSGRLPVCAQHPIDADFALMVHQSTDFYKLPGSQIYSVDLEAAHSLDGGATWSPLGLVTTGVDALQSGRPALAWLGDRVFVAYGTGTGIFCLTSADRGKTWSGAGIAASAGPYNTLSMTAHQGALYLFAYVGGNSFTYTPGSSSVDALLWRSGDLGKTWTLLPPLPTLLPQSFQPGCIFAVPASGQLRCGLSHHSDDSGKTWTMN